jgi:hypothetical protein
MTKWCFLIRAKNADRFLARVIQLVDQMTLPVNFLCMTGGVHLRIKLILETDEAQAQRCQAKLWKLHGVADVSHHALNERDEQALDVADEVLNIIADGE